MNRPRTSQAEMLEKLSRLKVANDCYIPNDPDGWKLFERCASFINMHADEIRTDYQKLEALRKQRRVSDDG